MTLQQMRYFIAVAQNLSFSKAAQQHYVSQTAVSQQIKLLEEELETELFQRTRHSVALTSAGQVFYEYAVRITDLAEDAARRTRAAAAECSTPLEIGMMSGMENLPILEKLLLFKEQHPAMGRPSMGLTVQIRQHMRLSRRLLGKRITILFR